MLLPPQLPMLLPQNLSSNSQEMQPLKGLSKSIKELIVKLHQGKPLKPEEDEFCLSLKMELEND